MRERRLAALVALGVVVVSGLAVHALGPAGSATDITGDALYAVAAYAGLVLLFPRWRRLVVGAVAALWCVGVELLQLTGVPVALADRFPPIALVLGSGFDARDLLVYLCAVGVTVAVDRVGGVLAARSATPRGGPRAKPPEPPG